MPTTVFAATDTFFTIGGFLAAAATFSGRSARQFTGWNCQLEFSATGTDCSITAFFGNDGTAVDVTVDGGAPTTLTPNAAWGSYTIFSGLSDTAHTVKIRITNIAKTYFYLDATSAISITGASPALGITSGLAQSIHVQNSTFRASAQLEGGWANFNTAGIVGLNTSNTLSVIRFKARCTSIRIYSYAQAQSGWILRVDGGALLSANIKVPNNTSTFEWLTLATGLDNTADHEYEIINTTQGGAWYLQNILCIGGSGTGQVANTYTERNAYIAIGTSITEGYNDTVSGSQDNHDWDGYAWRFAQARGLALWNVGLNSSTVVAKHGN